jgi:aminoglycoside phosphotransferase
VHNATAHPQTRQDVPWLPAGAHYLLLSGYSGAGIALVEDRDGSRYIRKIADGPSDNARLRMQADRQIAYCRAVDRVNVPDVLGCGEFEGRFFFDMQVVDGFDAATHLRTASFDSVAAVAEALSALIRFSAGEQPLSVPALDLRSALKAKLGELRLRLADPDPETWRALDRLEALSGEAPDELAPTLCHGDLTLENVLIDRRGQLWVVDLTPPPFEHVWLDVAKLLQDLDGGWYLRSGRGMNAGVRRFVRDTVLTAVDPRFGQYRRLLVALMFARILPYVRTDCDRDFVRARLVATLAAPDSKELVSPCS